jgi:hypothetical protein
VDCYCVFPHGFSILFFYFSKLYWLILFFQYWADWEFSFVIFFFKTLLIVTVFLRMVFFIFFWWFSLKLSFSILFFNIELVKNYSYNMWEKHCNFPLKLLWVAIVFFPTWFFSSFFCVFFFCNIFSQNYLCRFYFFNIKLVRI